MIIAVDVCVGKRGVKLLRDAGHVIIEARHAEPDREWFQRALDAKVELVVAMDNDLSILCWDHRVLFFRAWNGHSGVLTAQRVLLKYSNAV